MTALIEPAISLDISALLGDWRNTNADGRIARIVCHAAEGGRMTARCDGHADGAMRDWGVVDAPVYSFTFESREAGAFNAVFDLGTHEVHLQANVKLGVLVVASFNVFKDSSGRSNYFHREFFHRVVEG